MGTGIRSLKVFYDEGTVATNGAGAGTLAITFDTAFVSAPDVFVVQNEADYAAGARYTAASVTKNGFTLTVTGSTRVSQNIRVIWSAHEKD